MKSKAILAELSLKPRQGINYLYVQNVQDRYKYTFNKV